MSKPTSSRVLLSHTLAVLAQRVFVAFLVLVTLTSVYSITRAGTSADNTAYAAAPTTLNFQARLLNTSGSLVNDGNYSVEFKIYNTSSSSGSSQGSCTGDANCLWTETRTGGNQVQIKNGYLSAYLGDISALPTNIWNQQLYLTMNIHNGSGWDGEMTPRIRLTSVPYAFRATIAESAETLSKNTGSFTGTVDFATMTADRKFLFPDTSLATTASPGTICVYNGAASNCPAASGSAYYIQNDTVLQSASNFHIQARNSATNGTVGGVISGAAGGQTVDLLQFRASDDSTVLAAITAAGNLQIASSVDVRAAGTLSLGNTTATAITLGKAGITTTNAGALTVTEQGTFNGGLNVASNLTVTQAGNIAFQRNTTDYTATGTQSDINFGTGALFRITSASALTINSIAGGADGRIITLVNASSNAVTIANETGATAGNRILTGTGAATTIPVDGSIQLTYDSGASRWRVVGSTATSGGGANQQLSNLGSTNINAALNATSNDLTLQTTTSGNIVLNSAATIELQDNTNVTGTLAASTSLQAPALDTATAVALAIGTTSATNITVGHNAGTFAVDGTNFDLSTAGVITLAGGQTNDITTQSNQNLTLQANGTGTIVLNDTVTANGTMTFSGVTTDITTGTNEDLTLVANGSGTIVLNDTVTAAGTLTISGASTDITTATNEDLTVVADGTGIISLNDAVTVAGNFIVMNTGNVSFQRNTTNYTATGVQDNINFGTGVLFRITSASALTVNGIAGGADGRVITLANASANAVSIGNNASGTPANNVVTGIGGTLSVPAGSTVQMAYDSADSVWRVIGGTATGGGGANQQLSNLSGTVAINASLTPNADNTLDLGSSANSWKTLYADTSVLTPLIDTVAAGALGIGTTNATNITIGHNAGTFAVDGTNFDLSTAGVLTLAGGQTNDITTSANTNLTLQANGTGTISLNDTVSVAGTMTFSGVSTDITTGTNEDLTVVANGSGTIILNDTVTANGALTFNGVATDITTATNEDFTVVANGSGIIALNDNVTVGASAGSGTTFTNNGATLNATLLVNDDSDGGVLGGGLTSAQSVDIYTSFRVNQTTATQTITIPSPTNTAAGRVIYIANIGSTSFGLLGSTLNNGSTATLLWNGTAWTFAGADGTSINNQNTAQQSGNFWISGSGRADTSILTPAVDTATAVPLTIGTTTATNITMGHNAGTFAVDGTNFDLSTAGVLTLAGGQTTDITTQTNQNLTVVANGSGTISLNDAVSVTNTLTLRDGTTDLTTGTNEDLTVVANGTGIISLNDAVTVSGNFIVANTGNVAFQRNTTNYTATGTQSDINLGTGVLFRITSASALTINSIAGGVDGRIITLVNASNNAVTIANDTGSTAPNRIMTGTGASTLIPVDGSVELAYDSSSARWRVIGGSATSGGAANQQLSNLSGTIAINASLTPNADNTLDLGSSSFSWKTLYADTSVLTPAIDTVAAGALTIGTTNATNITIGHNAGTFAVDGTNFDLATNGVMTLAGGQTADITTQANQNLTVQANGTGTIVLNDTITAAGTLTFSGVSSDITTGTNEDLTVDANGAGKLVINDNTDIAAGASFATKKATSDYTTAGSANNVAISTSSLVRLDTSGAAQTITGIVAGRDGQYLTLINVDAALSVTISNLSGSSSAANQISTGTGQDIILPFNGTITMIYDSGASLWRVVGDVAVVGGGANQQLSNLSGTVAINTALNPNADNSIDLGTTANSWRTLYADTSVLTSRVDRAAAATLNIGTVTANAISISKSGVTTTVNGALTVVEATQLNGSLTLGASAGSGTLFTNNGATLNTSLPVSNDSDGGALGGGLTAAQSVDIYTGFTINQTTASQTITLPNPTSSTAGRIIYIANTGTASFGLLGSTLNAGSTATLLWNGSAWTFAGADGTSINNQKAAGQNGDFWIQSGGSSTGIGRADGGLQAPSLDTASAAALGIGTGNATNITIGHNAGTLAIDGTNFDLSTAGVITVAGGQTSDITTANASTATGITIKPGNSTGSNVAGAALTLQGGAATVGNANGGGVVISGGAGVGTGTQGLVALSTSAFTTLGPLAFGADTNVNALSANAVNLYSSITASATTSGKTLTINAPTLATVGRLLYVANVGSNDFNILLAGTSVSISLKPNTTATLIWNGTGWTAAGASSSTDLQSAYNNTLTSAGGAELVLNAPGGNADGFTIRNNGTTPITGGLLEVQTSVGSNILSVNNNATEYAQNGGSESGTGTSFTNGWSASATGGTQATVSRTVTAGEFTTGLAAAKVVTTGSTTANQGAADQIAVNGTNTALTANLTYTVSFAVKGTTNFATLDVVYSKDGTNTGTTACTTGKTVTQSVWSRITCTFTAPSSGITSSNAIFIRQSDSNSSAKTFYIDNVSVNINASTNHAVDGDADSAANIGGGANNWAAVSGSTVTQSTSTIYNTAGSVSVATAATSGRGVYNKLSNNIAPSSGTQYRVAFYARGDGTNTANLSVLYTPDNGTSTVACQDYNTQVVAAASWTLVSCYFTASGSVTNAQIRITQSSGSATTFYVDALTVTLNSNNSNNVQIGGANQGGPTTLLTLDRSSSAPIAANNDAYLGSMYYDTTTGRIQCYEADGWGACGSSPDNIITLTPEYTGAVLGGPGNVMGGGAQTPGIGVMTSEFCSSETGILVVGTLCANHEARNYYHWTSPQATEQIYSIYVSYKLPTTFKAFNDSNTIKLTALSDNNTNAIATLQVFRKKADGSLITACGNTAQTINSTTNTWQQKTYDAADETTCSFAGGDNIVFKIDMKSKSNGNIYVENLDFVYTNN